MQFFLSHHWITARLKLHELALLLHMGLPQPQQETRFEHRCGVAEQVSLLPPVAAIAATAVAGPSADALIARGWPVASVRRLAQATAFLGPAACLTAAAFSEDGPQTVGAFATH